MATYLVLGATGKTGSRLTRQLTAAGHTVRAGSRHPGPRTPGVEPISFDWDDAKTYGPALAGVQGVYLVPPELRFDHAPLLAALVGQAAAAGVERVVMLSARGVDKGPDNPMIGAERAVKAAAGDRVQVTVVRPSWFAQNFTESFFAPPITADGVIVAPTGDGRQAFIDAEDIAAVAAAALTGDGHGGHDYAISGPRAITFAVAARIIAPHAGRDVEHVDLPTEAWEQAATANGLPAREAGTYKVA